MNVQDSDFGKDKDDAKFLAEGLLKNAKNTADAPEMLSIE